MGFGDGGGVLVGRLQNGQTGTNRPLGVIFMSLGQTESGQKTVAHETQNATALSSNRDRQPAQRAIYHFQHFLWIADLLAHASGADDVGEENGRQFALLRPGGRFQHPQLLAQRIQ